MSYSKIIINNALAYMYKGYVNRVEDLPEDANVGDVYTCNGETYAKMDGGWDHFGDCIDADKQKEKVPKIYKCSVCGADIEEGQKQCDYCGSKISWISRM